MKFLFTAGGYPGVEGAGRGSGIGTYVRELSLGLIDRGHTCHALIWGDEGAPTPQEVEGVTVHLVSRGYWPVIERFRPEARDEWVRRRAGRRLMAAAHYDWVEIQSDEGIDIGIQRDFPDRVALRLHTTLRQMVEHKAVRVGRDTAYYLQREDRSLALAPRVLVHSLAHREALRQLYPWLAEPACVPHGLDIEPVAGQGPAAGPPPTFLLVGTPDRRKGFDRLRPVLEQYVAAHGPCRATIVSAADAELRREFGLDAAPQGVELIWRSNLSQAELLELYTSAHALLQLSRYESFGLPLIEAAACGTPVVSTATGVARELLQGDASRLVVDGDEPAGVAAALAAAVAERDALGAKLRGRYREAFTRSAMVDAFLNALAGWREQESTRA